MDLTILSPIEQMVILGILSLLFGSFTSLITYRIDGKQPIVFTRSKCPKCKKNLKIYNLIPLFSWIFQRGKCTNCHKKISIRYPLIEATFLIIFLNTFIALGQKIDFHMFIILAISSVLIYMCVVDLENYYIPNLSQYILAILVAVFLTNQETNNLLKEHFLPAFGYLFFGIGLWILFYYGGGIEAIGVDDLKFFFIAGLALGFNNFLGFMLLSGIFGFLFGSIWQFVKKDDMFPFAPAICASLYLCLIYDEKIDVIKLVEKLIF